MSVEYAFENLSGEPSIGVLQDSVAHSDMVQSSWVDISYHPEEHWLKIWFAEDLCGSDMQTLLGLVDACLGQGKLLKESGSVYFELVASNGKRWERHRRRVRFQISFAEVPAIVVSNANFDGTANLEILAATNRYFDFRITAGNGAGRVRGLTTVEFDWEAKECQA